MQDSDGARFALVMLFSMAMGIVLILGFVRRDDDYGGSTRNIQLRGFHTEVTNMRDRTRFERREARRKERLIDAYARYSEYSHGQ